MFLRTAFINQIMSKSKGKVFYAVGIGHKTGVYDSWSDCKKQVEGVSNPKFKKFDTLEGAQDFVKQWQSKSPNAHASPISPKQSSSSQHSRLSDSNQGEQHSLQQKGDTNLKKKKGKKNKKSDLNFNNNSAKRIYYSWNENGKGLRKNSGDRRLFYEINKKNGITSRTRKEEVKNKNVSDSVTDCRKGNTDSTTIQDINYSTNEQGVQACQTVVSSKWNPTNSAALPMYQTPKDSLSINTKSVSYQQYSITGRTDYSANCIQRSTCYIQYTDIVNTDILDLASISLPEERHPSQLKPVNGISMQGLAKNARDNESNIAETQTIADDSSEDNLSVISTPCKKSGTQNETIEEIQILSETDEANESGVESVAIESCITNEGDQTNKTSCKDTNTDNSETEINVVFKKHISKLVDEFKNELSSTIVTDAMGKIVDIARVVLKEIITSNDAGFVGGGSHQVKVNDFSKIKVSQLRECRKSNSFSGNLERTVDNITPTTIDMEEAEEGGGDAIDLTHLRENMRLCERKFDTLFCKFTEFFSCLTNVRNELKEMRKLLPRNGVLRNEMGSRKLEAGMTPNFSRSFAMNCDDEELCDAFKIQKEDSQRLGTVRTESTSSSGDIICQPTPAKRKRTWDEFRSSSKEPSLNEKIKEEHDDYVPFTTDEDDYVVVFTDGSCVSNGTLKAKAGIGIWFDDGHPLNVSRPLTGVEPTNNNAEIQAARIACELALSAGITKLKICTDSEFLINCITKWVKKWKSNGWMTGANKPVKNRVELEKLLDVISRLSVRWEKVEAHSNIKGNEMADRLANDGASCYVK